MRPGTHAVASNSTLTPNGRSRVVGTNHGSDWTSKPTPNPPKRLILRWVLSSGESVVGLCSKTTPEPNDRCARRQNPTKDEPLGWAWGELAGLATTHTASGDHREPSPVVGWGLQQGYNNGMEVASIPLSVPLEGERFGDCARRRPQTILLVLFGDAAPCEHSDA